MTVVVADTCTACGLCLATCPPRALMPAPRRPRVHDGRCTDCGLCIEVCPVDALRITEPAPVLAPVRATTEAGSAGGGG